jgi:hypothetical protein
LTTIDFGKALQDAKGASFEALPIGDYDVEVAKSEATTSQNGKPMIKTTMKVVTGPYEKRPIINNFVMSLENPQAVAIFFRHMKAFGLTEDFFASLGQTSSLEPVATALVGRRARLTLGHREWQGETRNEVKGVKPYTGAPQMGGPAGPVGPGAAGGVPLGGPAPLPPRAPAAPVAAPVPPPAAPPLPAAAQPQPQVQSVPQPPPAAPVTEPAVAAVPTAPPVVQEVVPSPSYAPVAATSAEAAPAAPAAPPQLPF